MVKGIYTLGRVVSFEALYSSWGLKCSNHLLSTHFAMVEELVMGISCLSQVNIEKDNKDNKITIMISVYIAISPLFVLSTLIATPPIRFHRDRCQEKSLSRCFRQCNELIVPENKMRLAGETCFDILHCKRERQERLQRFISTHFWSTQHQQLHQKLCTINMNTRSYGLSTFSRLSQSAKLNIGLFVLVIACTA